MSEMNRRDFRKCRHVRLRRRVSGTALRPRMAIMISNRHMYVQFVDDVAQKTLAAASSLAGDDKGGPTVPKALALGRTAAKAAQEAGISLVVVDRGGFKFHGRVKALVDGALEGGLKISTKPAESADAAAVGVVQEKEEA